MSKLNRKGFHELDLDERLTLFGQLLLTSGTAFLSLGQIFKLLKADNLPTTPFNQQSVAVSTNNNSLYSNRRTYFES